MAFYNRQEFTEMTDGRILYADDMQRAAAIYFPQAYQIMPDYRDNGRVLSEVAAALAKLRESRDFMLKSIVVAGFASRLTAILPQTTVWHGGARCQSNVT